MNTTQFFWTMNSAKVILAFVLLHQLVLTNEFSLRPKFFKIERAGSCKLPLKYGGKLENFDLSQPIKNIFHLDADIRFFDDITDAIQFTMKYTKCTLGNEGSTCDDNENLVLDNFCEQLADKNALWTPLLKIIKPPLACPIKKGRYTVRNGTLDLSMISRLPIDGYRYVTTMAIYESFKNGTPPLQLLCFDSDVVVTLRSSGRTRTRGKSPLKN